MRLSTSLVRIIFQQTCSEELHLDKHVNRHRHAPFGTQHLHLPALCTTAMLVL